MIRKPIFTCQPRLFFSATIRIAEHAFPLLCIGILCAEVYDMCHPNSHPTIVTVLALVGSAATAFLFLRYNFIRQPQSLRMSLILLIVLGLSLRLFSILSIHNEQVSDFQTFHELSCALCNGDGFAFTGQALKGEVRLFLNRYDEKGPLRTAFRLPGAPLMFAVVYSLFGQRPIWGKLLNAALGTGVGLLMFLLLYPENPLLAFRSSLLWQLYPSAIIATNLVGTEIPFTACILLSAVFLKKGLRLLSSKPLAWCACAGLCSGYACLIRPAAFFLLLCGIWCIIVSAPRFRQCLPAVLIFIVSMSLLPAAWGLRNLKTFGEFECQTTETGVAWFEMTRNIIKAEEERQFTLLENTMHTSTDEFELSRTGMKIGEKRLMLAVKRISFVKVLLLNHCKSWNHDHSMLEWAAGFREHPQAPPLSRAAYGFLFNTTQIYYLIAMTLAICGGFRIRRIAIAENPGLLTLVFYLLASSILFCILHGTTRYHFPLMPVIFIGAAHGIGMFQRRKKS